MTHLKSINLHQISKFLNILNFHRKNKRTHKSKVTSPNERRGQKAREFEHYSSASSHDLCQFSLFLQKRR